MSCFWGHDFSQWTEKDHGTIFVPADNQDGSKKRVIGWWLLQERKCKKCGYVEINEQSEYA